MEDNKLTLEAFADKMLEGVNKHFKDTDYEAEKQVMYKNNNVALHGITLRNTSSVDKSVSPTLYIEGAYMNYSDGACFEDLLEEICENFENNKEAPEEIQSFNNVYDLDYVREHSFIKLVARENNDEYLKGMLKREFLNMYMVPYISLVDDDTPFSCHATTMVRDTFLDQWNITEDEAFDIALKNTSTKLWYKPIISVLEKMQGIHLSDEDEKAFNKDTFPMFVFGTKNMLYGASVMAYPEYLDDCMLKEGYDSMVIIPSSVNEIIGIMYHKNSYDPAQFSEIPNMIRDVNDTQVQDQEILTYTAYTKEMGKDIEYYSIV